MNFIRNRITELREKRGISEYQLSYDLGHGKNYVHNIVSGYSQPSLKELLYLFEVLGVSAKDFFDEERQYCNPLLAREIMDELSEMNENDMKSVLAVARSINKKNNYF